MGWVGGTHTMRYHAHYQTSGMGHLYQQRYKSFAIQDDEYFFVVCRYVERNALRAGLVDRAEDWRWSSLWRWLQKPEPDPKLLSAWSMARLPGWVDRVNQVLTEPEIEAVRLCAQRGRPMGDEGWVESISRRLNLESTMRPRGRPRVRFSQSQQRGLTPLIRRACDASAGGHPTWGATFDRIALEFPRQEHNVFLPHTQ